MIRGGFRIGQRKLDVFGRRSLGDAFGDVFHPVNHDRQSVGLLWRDHDLETWAFGVIAKGHNLCLDGKACHLLGHGGFDFFDGLFLQLARKNDLELIGHRHGRGVLDGGDNGIACAQYFLQHLLDFSGLIIDGDRAALGHGAGAHQKEPNLGAHLCLQLVLVNTSLGIGDVKGPTGRGRFGIEADGGFARAQHFVHRSLKARDGGCGRACQLNRGGLFCHVPGLERQFEFGACVKIAAQEQYALHLCFLRADIEHLDGFNLFVAVFQRKGPVLIFGKVCLGDRQVDLLHGGCAGLFACGLVGTFGRGGGGGIGAFVLGQRDVKADVLEHREGGIENRFIGKSRCRFLALQFVRRDIAKVDLRHSVFDGLVSIDKVGKDIGKHCVIDRRQIHDGVVRPTHRQQRRVELAQQRADRQLFRQVVSQKREVQRRVGQIELTRNDPQRIQQALPKGRWRRNVKHSRPIPVIGRTAIYVLGIPDQRVKVHLGQTDIHRRQGAIDQQRRVDTNVVKVHRDWWIAQRDRDAKDREVDVEARGVRQSAIGQDKGVRDLLFQHHIFGIRHIDVKAEIQLGQENILAAYALNQRGHEFDEGRIVPAEFDREPIVDHLAVMFDLADHLLEFILRQIKLGQNQFELQRRKGKARVTQRAKPKVKSFVRRLESGRDHALLGQEVQHGHVVPARRDLQAKGVCRIADGQFGKNELFGLNRHFLVQEAKDFPHEAIGRRDFPPEPRVVKIGRRQVHCRIDPHEAVDMANGAARLMSILDEDLIAKGHVGFALITIVINFDIFLTSLVFVLCHGNHSAFGKNVRRIIRHDRQQATRKNVANGLQQLCRSVRRN